MHGGSWGWEVSPVYRKGWKCQLEWSSICITFGAALEFCSFSCKSWRGDGGSLFFWLLFFERISKIASDFCLRIGFFGYSEGWWGW